MASTQDRNTFLPEQQHLAEGFVKDAAGQQGLPLPDSLRRVWLREKHLEACGGAFERRSAPPASSSSNTDSNCQSGFQERDISLIAWLVTKEHFASYSQPSSTCCTCLSPSPPSYEESFDTLQYPSLSRSSLSSDSSLNQEAFRIWAPVSVGPLQDQAGQSS